MADDNLARQTHRDTILKFPPHSPPCRVVMMDQNATLEPRRVPYSSPRRKLGGGSTAPATCSAGDASGGCSTPTEAA